MAKLNGLWVAVAACALAFANHANAGGDDCANFGNPCQLDSECDDGLFCTGDEFCNSVANDTCGCVTEAPTCEDFDGCTVDVCDRSLDQCVNDPVCGVPPFLVCISSDPNPYNAMCVQCDSNNACNDGIDCTIDECFNNSCGFTTQDGFCDDGVFCNGAETCHPMLGCQAGAAPNCNDNWACTQDLCNEATDSCDHAPNDATCDDGVFCNGLETCSPPTATASEGSGCQAGVPPDCDDGVDCTIDTCDRDIDDCRNTVDHALCAHRVLFVNVNGSYNGDGNNLAQTIRDTGAIVTSTTLSSNGQVAALLQAGVYDQVWIYDLSSGSDNYPSDWAAVAAWFNADNDRAIICDARILSSYAYGHLDEGRRLSTNYYENMRQRGGGILLGTDHDAFQTGINSINDQIGIQRFCCNFSLDRIPVDTANPLMTFPNDLGTSLWDNSSPGQTPFGLQANGRVLYSVAWHSGNTATPGISATIPGIVNFVVHISSPSNGAIFRAGELVTLSATPTNGTPPFNYNWSSSIEGSIGAGQSITISDLSVGAHEIRLLAEDSQGLDADDSVTITIQAIPDLIVTSIKTSPSVVGGQGPDLTWSVVNVGSASANGTWSDAVYLSVDEMLSEDDLALGTSPPNGPLATGSGYLRFDSPVIPLLQTPGYYYILVKADSGDSIDERPHETNNVGAGGPILVYAPPLPDLAIATLAAPTAATAGDVLIIEYTVANLAPTAVASPWQDAIYLSTDAILDSSTDALIRLDPISEAPLQQYESYLRSRNVTIPVGYQATTAYLIVRTEAGDGIGELSEANNIRVSDAISILVKPAPNLIAELQGVVPSSAAFGETITVDWLGRNTGTDAARGTWSDHVFLSTDENASADDRFLGSLSINVAPLAPDASYTRSTVLLLPLDLHTVSGDYCILVKVDGNNAIGELSESDNVSSVCGVHVELPSLPNIEIHNVAAPATVAVGDTIQLTWDVVNTGGAPSAASFLIAVFASDDNQTGNDLALANILFDQLLAPKQVVTAHTEVSVPELHDNQLYFVACADMSQDILEADEGDNCSTTQGASTYSRPDLAVSEFEHPSHVEAEAATALSWTVENLGLAPAEPFWIDAVYLSGDAVFGNDILLRTHLHNAVVPASQSYSGQSTVTIPADLEGDYYFVVEVDRGDHVIEIGDPGNNVRIATSPTTIVQPPRPNLVIETITTPTSGLVGRRLPVDWMTRNVGVRPATAFWIDRVFASMDDELSDDDFLMGSAQSPGTLGPGATYVGSALAQYPSLPGNYHLIVVTDATNTVREGLSGGEEDNVRVDKAIFDVGTFQVISTVIAPKSAPAGTHMSITGQAIVDGTSQPASDVPVSIGVEVQGFVRWLDARTDANGRFQAEFVPGPTEGGRYGVFASPSHIISPPEVASFTLWSLVSTPFRITQAVLPGIASEGHVTLKNPGDIAQSGIRASLLNPSADVMLGLHSADGTDLISDPIGLAASASELLTFQVTALSKAASNSMPIQIEICSSEGARTLIEISLEVGEPRAAIVAVSEDLAGGNVAAAPLRGERSFAQFRVRNIGATSTEALAVELPGIPWMRLATPQPIQPIPPGGDAAILLQLDPPSDHPFGVVSGNVWVHDSHVSLNVPFRFEIVSNGIGDIVIRATDEGTYWNSEEGFPLVANAHVTLHESIGGALAASGFTDSSGIVGFHGLTEAYYNVEVTAPAHGTFRTNVLVAAAAVTQLEAFMPQDVITYTWTVVPTEVEDEYRIIITADFETDVPVPVVTMEPAAVDLLGLTLPAQVDFTITNHGLVTADNVTFNIGQSSVFELTPLVTDIGDLPALTSVVVPMLVNLKDGATASSAVAACDPVFVRECHELVCGPKTYTYCIPSVLYQGNCPPVPGGSGGGGGGGPGGGGGGGGPGGGTTFTFHPVQTQPVPCDPCALKCLGAAAGCTDFSCPIGVATCAINVTTSPPKEVVGNVVDCIGTGVDCALDIAEKLTPLAGILSCACSLLRDCRPTGSPFGNCNDAAGNVPCSPGEAISFLLGLFSGSGESRDDEPTDLGYEYFKQQVKRLGAFVLMYEYIFGDVQWVVIDDTPPAQYRTWMTAFQSAVADSSDFAGLISETERAAIKALPYSPTISPAHVDAFVTRWNRSVEYWNQGILNEADVPSGFDSDFIALDRVRFFHDYVAQAEKDVIAEGFNSIVDAYHYARLVLEADRAEVGEGVCATVRIQLDQTAAVTRSAFRATLDLDNGGADPLEAVLVEISIKNATGHDASSLFGIKAPDLEGIAAIDGTGSVPGNASAVASWVIIPTDEAAPFEPEEYFVSGTLMYELRGMLNTVPLLPVRIDVLPDPKLQLKYFLETIVYSDDPFTPEREPAIPFSLGLLVKNNGAGIAKNMRITSAQPEIVDNERGLLIDFDIIGTQVDSQERSPSLTVNLGDIGPDQTAVARWLMTASFQGEFVSYSAEFEHINSLGDPRLSLIDSVDIYGLNHVVLASDEGSDNLPDFLTNDFPDLQDLPDRVHLSDGSVAVVRPVDATVINVNVGNLEATLTAAPSTGWSYYRADDPFGPGYGLALATRSDGIPVVVGYNAWQTSRVNRSVSGSPEENFVHIFDNGDPGTYTLKYVRLVPSAPALEHSTATTIKFLNAGIGFGQTIPHAVFEETTQKYVGPEGLLQDDEFWQPLELWNGLVLRSLRSTTEYCFKSKAQLGSAGAALFGPTSCTSTSIQGDTDGDALVTQEDVLAVQQALGTRYAELGFEAAADLDGDSAVTYADYGIVQRGLLRGDFNRDGFVASNDVVVLAKCLTGPSSLVLPAPCRQGDFDLDDDIDLHDVAAFQRSYEPPQ